MAWTTPGTATAGEVLTAAFWNTNVRDNLNALGNIFGAATTYTPSLTASTTNPTLGSGGSFLQDGSYYRLGFLVYGHALLRFGTSGASAGSGTYRISLPQTSTMTSGQPIGQAWMQDENTGARQVAIVVAANASYVELQINAASGYTGVTNAAPWTWAASDFINVSYFYTATTASS